MNELNLGNEKIIKLIKKFSIPCVISMVVAALVADVIGAVVALVLVIINIRKAEKTNKQ